MLVTDASVLVAALVDDEEDGRAARDRLRGNQLRAPEIVDLEVLAAVRNLVSRGELQLRRAEFAVRDLMAFPLMRVPSRWYLSRCWELRNNVTVYDAAYVALAEASRSTLVTTDARLSRAPGLRCDIEVLQPRR